MSYRLLFFVLFPVFLLHSCSGGYSFSGGDVGEAKTVSVDLFPNNAPLVQPNLSQLFTESLKDIFIQQTNLRLVKNDGDLHFEGSIVEYNIRPMSPQADQTASQSRLTIGVNVIFTNQKDPDKSFEERFSRFADFDADQNFSTIEEQLIQQINEELGENILNRAIVNW